MNPSINTERPKLKLNFGSKPLILNTNASTLVAGSALKKVVVFEKSKSDVKDVGNSPATSDKNDEAIGTAKTNNKTVKQSKSKRLL